jgi:hypothetical protein
MSAEEWILHITEWQKYQRQHGVAEITEHHHKAEETEKA